MEKRYQVFVSSTFADLQHERRKVTQTLMELDCIPAGMELFPAADEEQWAFIRKILDDCDYYLLIIGGRYGSLTNAGVSFTEREYDHAVERGLRVLAFLHEQPEAIPAGKSEVDADSRLKLERFRDRVSHSRLVGFWKNADELPGLVALSLSKTIKAYPAVGWIRATGAANVETLSELNELRKKVGQLKLKLTRVRQETSVEPLVGNLVPLAESVTFGGSYQPTGISRSAEWSQTVSWLEAFSLIAPTLLEHPPEPTVRAKLTRLLLDRARLAGHNAVMRDYDFDTLKMQLVAHRLVKFKTADAGQATALFWSLTRLGLKFALESRTVRSKTPEGGA